MEEGYGDTIVRARSLGHSFRIDGLSRSYSEEEGTAGGGGGGKEEGC